MRGVNHVARRVALGVGALALIGLLNASESVARQDLPAVQAPMPRTSGAAPAAPAASGQLALLGRETYLIPPKEIADAVLSSRSEAVTYTNLSPDGRKFLITKRDALPPIERLGCP